MLHRMALRVLPSLTLAVTEASVRKKKRMVMFVPGLVAFGLYRLVKHVLPLSEPVVLLTFSGLVGLMTAFAAYHAGRGAGGRTIVREDGGRLLAWVGGWIGFVYAMQLSLLVLALLWLVGYDYLQHPDGPAMMAVIISCTAVARDAFEIGHVRKVALMGRPFPTFPNGMEFRSLLHTHAAALVPWVLAGAAIGAAAGSMGQLVEGHRASAILQVFVVTTAGGLLTLCAYFGGLRQRDAWAAGLRETKAGELMKYWWWPGLAFASTYYLVAMGGVLFLMRNPGVPTRYAVVAGAVVSGLMSAYGYYLGYRRHVEEAQGQSLSPALLRCPFVMGILGKSPSMGAAIAAPGSKG